MSEYDILNLMDTYNALKRQGVQVPTTFREFLSGIRILPSAGTVAQINGVDRPI